MPDALFVVDVGHGNAAVHHANGLTTIVDAGPGSALLEFLREQKVTSIDLLIISHADADHIAGGIGLLTSGIAIERVYVNGDPTKNPGGKWQAFLVALDEADRNGKLDFRAGFSDKQTADLQKIGFQLEVVAPSSLLVAQGVSGRTAQGAQISSNTLSAVVRILHNGEGAAILAGDLDEPGLADLAGRAKTLSADVLVYPHHGGSCGGNDARFAGQLLGLVKPKEVVFSNGRGRYATPLKAIAAVVRSGATAPRIACTQLSTTCSASAAVSDAHLTGFYAAGRPKRHCCAGTIFVALPAGKPPIIAKRAAHDAFVQTVSGRVCV